MADPRIEQMDRRIVVINRNISSLNNIEAVNGIHDGEWFLTKDTNLLYCKIGNEIKYIGGRLQTENIPSYEIDFSLPSINGVKNQILTNKLKNNLTVHDFVVNEYNYDNTENLRNYHNYCNINNINASYSGLETLFIQANAQISVNTSWDLNGVLLKLLNGLNPDATWNSQSITFKIQDPFTPLVSKTVDLSVDNCKRNSLFPTKGFVDEAGYVLLKDPSTLISNRDATNTASYTQSFHIINNGKVSQPLSSTLTGKGVILSHRKNSLRGKLNIKNINLNHDNDWNNQILIEVARNNVSIDGFTLSSIKETILTNISSLVMVRQAANFTFSNIVSKGIEYQTSGTYILNIDGGADVTFNNVFTADGWGWIGSNRINGLFVNNSSVMRIDGHESIHNVFINNVSFHDIGLSVGWGGGTIMMSNITLHNSSAYYSRPDYGNNFDGSIIINGVILREYSLSRPLVDMGRAGNSIVPIWLARSISISNVTSIPNNELALDGFYLLKLNVKSNKAAVYAPHSISINNVQLNSDSPIDITIDYGGMRGFGYTNLNMNGIFARSIALNILSSNELNATTPVKLTGQIQNLVTLKGTSIISTHPISKLNIIEPDTINELTVTDSKNGIVSNITVRGGRFGISGGESKKFGVLNMEVFGTSIYGAVDLQHVRFMQGCTLLHPANAILPLDATEENIFTGWKKQ